jgi:hypothetical protein
MQVLLVRLDGSVIAPRSTTRLDFATLTVF